MSVHLERGDSGGAEAEAVARPMCPRDDRCPEYENYNTNGISPFSAIS